MFHLDDTEIETSLSQLQQSWLTTLLCGGIVNPFGPTLTAVLLLGEIGINRSLDIVKLVLNPFSQGAYRIGRATFHETWNPVHDYKPLLNIPVGSCPTLLLPSTVLEAPDVLEIHKQWISNLPDAQRTWRNIQSHLYDPWQRVSDDMQSGSGEVEARLKASPPSCLEGDFISAEDALTFATVALSDAHGVPELQAFLYAWQGSIQFQSDNGSSHVLPR